MDANVDKTTVLQNLKVIYEMQIAVCQMREAVAMFSRVQ